jgi:nicotinate dehydrogenase subunit A
MPGRIVARSLRFAKRNPCRLPAGGSPAPCLLPAACCQLPADKRRIGAMPRYTFRLNGRETSVDSWDPAQPLLYALRGPLALHGPKFGCGLGQCGACTVIVDRTATRSCTLPVSRAAGRDITTLEGLGTPEKPDGVQAAFIAEQAAQCGYCTNGMIMAAKALIARTPKPSVDQIKQALDGNLCRCGTHTRIVRAIQRASQV